MLVTGALVSPLFYRVARAATLAVTRSPYVEAALISGASIGWVVRRHVWAKVLPPIAVALAQTIGVGFVIVSSLTFLGIGVQPPAPTWGGLLASDLGYLSHQPWAPLAPALLIMVTVWACNLLADAIRDVSGEAGRALVNSRKARANRRREVAPPPPEVCDDHPVREAPHRGREDRGDHRAGSRAARPTAVPGTGRTRCAHRRPGRLTGRSSTA